MDQLIYLVLLIVGSVVALTHFKKRSGGNDDTDQE